MVGERSFVDLEIRRVYSKQTKKQARVQADYVKLITCLAYVPREKLDKFKEINPENMLECLEKKWMGPMNKNKGKGKGKGKGKKKKK